ncbi:DUF4192 domain-containing protein [Nocardioides perillae]|uniref:DUF4192 domain-containing protein n=1 Tax=Nocardioides perillae TaxID=1119534 RepID=A0A7Y9RT88_9ACTN|nr:DUF4192 domain-containing protein [Nocardioides perillae]NYG56167.1 hypothetical protein [Nocardioides perillae]
MTTPTPSPAPTYTVRSPEDLLALVPVVLGFEPEESVTLLGFPDTRGVRQGRCFHGRVDLPDGPDTATPDAHEVHRLVEAITEPVVRHAVPRVVLVVHSTRPALAGVVVDALLAALAERAPGAVVPGVVLADGRRWWTLPGGGPPRAGCAYDVAHHPLRLQAVVDGRVTHPSRAALAATLDPEPSAVARVAEAARSRPWLVPAAGPGRPGDPGEPGEPDGAATAAERDAAFVGEAVRGAMRPPTERPVLDDDAAARLLLAVREPALREVACLLLTRATAEAHTTLWRDLVRRAPDHLRGPAATLLALSAWVAGDGALAWCALDRCGAGGPAATLADLVASMLERAVPPEVWERCVQAA